MTQYATVQFKESTAGYTFKHDIPDLSVGDYVVCDTSQGISLGMVTNIEPTRRAKDCATKWIIQAVNMVPHIQRLEAERIMAEYRANQVRRRQELTSRLNTKQQVFRQKQELELLKASDPEVVEILEELEKLENI